ncbi:MAG: 3-hydroxybutyrate dehydrogenase [Hyphomicrobiales bacterium]|uniref:3-hydroxybutyrate dehydrogenase n=1 Tax=Nisaea sp. TaxID=2024842 RepID=UPI003281F23D
MLQGKNAVVTGSTSGIGLGIARQLAKAGANVAINSYTDSEEDHKIAADLAQEFDVKAIFVSADMSKADACVSLVETASKELGTISILVNNAGIQFVSPVEEFPPQKWDAIMAINLSSVFHTTRAAVPGMKENGWGRIINISSAHGLTASPYKSAYVAAKHGVVGFTKSVALELAEQNVTCNAVCPGYVMTPLIDSQIPEQMKTHNMDRETVIRDVMLARQPTKEFATTEQIGDIVAFLCSDAAAQITGTPLSVDGGWTAL